MTYQYIASNLPMDRLEVLREYYRRIAKLHGRKLRIRFRGPRFDFSKAYCLKENARYFAVYFY